MYAAALRGVLGRLDADLPRLFVIETEYQLHMIEAQAQWVRGLLGELTDGTLPGTAEWRAWHETGELPEDWTDLEERLSDTEPPPGPAAGRAQEEGTEPD